MKIDSSWIDIGRDDKHPVAVALNRELNEIHNSMLEDEAKIVELQRSSFYKQQLIEQLFKEKNEFFNGVVPTRFIFKNYNDGAFIKGNLKTNSTKLVLKMIVANFFPHEIWSKIEFIEAIRHAYENYLDLSFSWEYKKGKFVEFRIELYNPDSCSIKVFSPTDHKASEYLKKFDVPYTTKLHVNYSYDPKKENNCVSYDYVCSGYLNVDIRQKLLEKLDEIVENAEKHKSKRT